MECHADKGIAMLTNTMPCYRMKCHLCHVHFTSPTCLSLSTHADLTKIGYSDCRGPGYKIDYNEACRFSTKTQTAALTIIRPSYRNQVRPGDV
jgi:hypothetical protein